jgi:tetratricopeptide (TPR) repeat protein
MIFRIRSMTDTGVAPNFAGHTNDHRGPGGVGVRLLLIPGLVLFASTLTPPTFGQDADTDPAAQAAVSDKPTVSENADADKPADADKAAASPQDGQADLDEAMIRRIDAETPKQLEAVIALIESALTKGLSEESRSFAAKMIASIQLERAQGIAAQLMQGGGLRARQLRSEALEVLKSALESDPELVEAYLLIARLNLLPEGDAEEVLKSTTKAIELLADNPQAQSGAYLLRALRQTDEKLRSDDLDAAIKTNPTNAEAIQARALLRLQNNDVNGAVDDLKALLKQDPTNQAVAQVAVQQLVEMGRTSDALTLLDEALQASPSEGLYRLRGIIYRAEGKEDEALADFDKALAMQPKDPISLLQRAEISLGRGDVKAAKRDLSEAIRVEPRVVDSVAAVRVRCYIAVEEGRMADAINDMNLIVQADPENSFWTLQLANLYLQDKRPRKAIELATAIIDREPENVSALRTRADTLLGLGDHAGAIKDYERAIEVGVDNPLQKSGILNNLAWVLATSPKDELRSGERSVKFGTEAAELTEFKEPHILSTLAAGYAEQGDFEKAVQWSTKAVELGRELEHEQVEQLEEELKSYQENKPWREEQETEENRAPLLGPDDLIDT